MHAATRGRYREGYCHCPQSKRIFVDLDQAIPDWAKPILYNLLVAFRRRRRFCRLLGSLHPRRDSPARGSEKRYEENYVAKKRDGAGLDFISHSAFKIKHYFLRSLML